MNYTKSTLNKSDPNLEQLTLYPYAKRASFIE